MLLGALRQPSSTLTAYLKPFEPSLTLTRCLRPTTFKLGYRSMSASPPPPSKRRRVTSTSSPPLVAIGPREVPFGYEYGPQWKDWPAPKQAMEEARDFIMDIVDQKMSVLIVPDKDADGLSAGTLLYKTLIHLGHPPNKIAIHHLSKGTSIHTPTERERMDAYGMNRTIVLDQGSRPGPPLTKGKVLVIDHHFSSQFPDDAQVLTACNSIPIATAALLTYVLLRDLHPAVRTEEAWRAIVGVVGDLGPREAKWGVAPWPAELAQVIKEKGSKAISDCVAGINAPRRTAEYNVPRAWEIYLSADEPRSVGNNAYLKLCKLDVQQETEKWARTAPKFSADGKVAVITVDSAFQIHPVIATRWAGNLGKKSKKLIMIMCANVGFNPDVEKVSFSCRIASGLRSLPEEERPNLIAMLEDYAAQIPDFKTAVGADFARGHKEATGGIILKEHFGQLLDVIGVGQKPPTSPSTGKTSSPVKKKDAIPQGGQAITNFFKPSTNGAVKTEAMKTEAVKTEGKAK